MVARAIPICRSGARPLGLRIRSLPGSPRAGNPNVAPRRICHGKLRSSPALPTTVGFDRLGSLFDTLGSLDNDAPSYPPYNIELVDENTYRVGMAVAGFSTDDLNLEAKETRSPFAVRANREGGEHLPPSRHRRPQISSGNSSSPTMWWSRTGLENGLLHVELVRELPEAMKPRAIQIATKGVEAKSEKPKVIDSKAA